MRYIPIPILLVLVSCVVTVNDAPRHAPATELTLDVEVEPLTITWGNSLRIVLTVANKNNKTVTKHFSSGCIYGYSLRTRNGEVVAPPPPICTMNAPTVTYQPGELVTKVFLWVWDDPSIEPGTYILFAGFGPRGDGKSSPSVEVRLK